VDDQAGERTAAMTGRWVVRRTVYLLIGGAIAVAVLMLASLLAAPAQGDVVPDLRVPLVAALVLMAVVGLLPGIREVQVAAAQTLLGAVDVTVPEPMRWEHRWRTALWTFVHQIVGAVTAVAIGLAALVVAGTVAFAGGAETIDMVQRIDRPESAGGWVLLGGGAVVAVLVACAVVIGGGLSARWAAPLLLGSSGADRLAAAERRLRREQEYKRLSRDLHDGVGHALSAISLQAVAGERLVRQDADRAATALASIQQLAADAVAELDQVLGMLRDEPAPRTPEPTLADLPGLVRRHRELGLALDVDMDPDLRIPGPLSRTAYRICAEALSNAAKHAGPGSVTLRVLRDGRDVVVQARNPSGGSERTRRDGHGLAGLRTTVAVFGGQLSAGPDGPDWVLEARLPEGGRHG
jgi:signal transduction histidine kinase